MDTKLKAKGAKILSILSVIIIFIGYICLCISLLNADFVVSYMRSGSNVVHTSTYNKKDEVLGLLQRYCLFYNYKLDTIAANEDLSYIEETPDVSEKDYKLDAKTASGDLSYTEEKTDVNETDLSDSEDISYVEGELDAIETELSEYVSEGYRFAVRTNDSDIGGKFIYQDDLSGDITLSSIYSQRYNYADSFDYFSTDENGNDTHTHYSIYVWLNEDTAVKNILALEETQSLSGKYYFNLLICGACIILAGMVISGIASSLSFSAGKREIHFHNRIYNDVMIFIYLFISFWILYFSVHIFGTGYRYENYPIEFFWIAEILGGALFTLLSFMTVSNIVKRCRRDEFIRYTLIYSVISFVIRGIKKLIKFIKSSVNNIIRAMCTNLRGFIIIFVFISCFVLLVNTFIILYLWAGYRFLYGCLYALISFTVIGFILLKLASNLSNELEEIKKATERMRNGDLENKLDTYMNPVFGNLPDDLNHISEGMDKAVKKATASEKMKTELISNVSHDLKTPLTSIISYVEFLSEDETLSDESKDYVNIIKQKSLRLKNIISDLFDLSKASSSNEMSIYETLGFKQLVEQTVTEMSDKLEESKSPLKLTLPQNEIYILGDGKKLYRVLQNLIDNAIKYSMPGTRIFAELFENKGEAVFSIKNISSYEMNFTSEEIIERFKRGDESRSSEGSGLGLSIADTFTNNCGGKLNITIDGDVFKAEVVFKAITK